MKTKTTNDQLHGFALKKFHTLCSKAQLKPEEKASIIESYGVVSSKDLSLSELNEACKIVEGLLSGINTDMDKLRKRLIASIDGYLQLTAGERNIDIIKGIACRASGYKSFNEIPRERLINLYSAFVNKQKDFKRVGGFVHDDLITKSILN